MTRVAMHLNDQVIPPVPIQRGASPATKPPLVETVALGVASLLDCPEALPDVEMSNED